MSTPGVPGMVGRTSPRERPALPLVVPSRLRASAESGRWRLRFGGCFAAEERRRRCPAEAWKDDWEASVTYRTGEAARNVGNAATLWLATTGMGWQPIWDR